MFDQKLSGVPRQDLNPAVKSSAGADILMTGWVTEIARGELQGGWFDSCIVVGTTKFNFHTHCYNAKDLINMGFMKDLLEKNKENVAYNLRRNR